MLKILLLPSKLLQIWDIAATPFWRENMRVKSKPFVGNLILPHFHGG